MIQYLKGLSNRFFEKRVYGPVSGYSPETGRTLRVHDPEVLSDMHTGTFLACPSEARDRGVSPLHSILETS